VTKTTLRLLARLRVPLGFLSAVGAYWWARPTPWSCLVGGSVALLGEGVRIWASGHLDKGREVTRSGPYRFVRHPLYLGSAIMGAGFAAGARTPATTAIVVLYLGVTLLAAIRTEEAVLDERFRGEYSAYRQGLAAPVVRPFNLERAFVTNKESRAVLGLAVGMALLWVRMQLG
jgi:protein-S-isoprenylcysteine O-methyltransferase Ste14